MIDPLMSSTRHIRYLLLCASTMLKETVDGTHLGVLPEKLKSLKPRLYVPEHLPGVVAKAIEERAELVSLYRQYCCTSKAAKGKIPAITQSDWLCEQLTEIYTVLEKAPKYVEKDWEQKLELVGPYKETTDEQRLDPEHDIVPMLAPDLWYYADDWIGIWVETKLVVNDMHAILCRMSHYWVEAAEKELPIIVPVWLANVSLQAMRIICRSRRHLFIRTAQQGPEYWAVSVNEEPTRRLTAEERLAVTCQTSGGFIYEESHNEKSFFEPGILTVQGRLNNIKTLAEENAAPAPSTTFVDNLKAFKRRPKGPLSIADLRKNNDADRALLDKVLATLKDSLLNKKAIREIEMIKDAAVQSEQLAAVLQSFFDFEDTESVEISDTFGEYHSPVYTNICPPELTFGVELLLTSFRAFSWPDIKQKKPNKTSACSLPKVFSQTIRTEIRDTLAALFSDDPKSGLSRASICADFLRTFDTTLERFLDEDESFEKGQLDLYHMTPWIAGGHVLTMLNRAFTEGIIITHGLPHVRLVLHLYHALRKSPSTVVDMPRIELFDGLCEAFKATLFGGQLPEKDFENFFRKVETDHPPLSPHEAHDQAVRTSQALSLVRRYYGDKHVLNGFFWAHAVEDPPITAPSNEQLVELMTKVGTVHFDTCLETLKESVRKEFEGSFPIMRLNLFAVFRLCQKLLRRYAKECGQKSVVDGIGGAQSALSMIDLHMGEGKSSHEPIQYLQNAKMIFGKLENQCQKEKFFWEIDGLMKEYP